MILSGFEVQLIWYGQDVVKYRFTCSNLRFCRQAEAYLSHKDILDVTERLKGFPGKPSDCREFELGTFDPKCAGGGIQLRFSCLDSVGHSILEVELRSEGQSTKRHLESVAMRIPVEAAAVDSFVEELGAIGLNVAGKTYLQMAV